MSTFTRLPADTVEALQWFPGRPIAGVSDEWPGQPGGGGLLPSPPHAYFSTRRGRLTVFAGDWIITESTGEMHLCDDSLFRIRYAAVVPARRRK